MSSSGVVTATCPSGEIAVSGGFQLFSGYPNLSAPTSAGDGWSAAAFNNLSTKGLLSVYAYCSPGISLAG
jgi:hypothetical protein